VSIPTARLLAAPPSTRRTRWQTHPGDVSLAQRGALFLYERSEFGQTVSQVHRQPMEAVWPKYDLPYPLDVEALAALATRRIPAS